MADNKVSDQIKLTDAAKDKYVAFGKSTKKLGERTPDELVDLAAIARSSQDPSLLELFDGELPALADLQSHQTDQLKRQAEQNAPKRPAAVPQKPATANTTQPNVVPNVPSQPAK